MIKDDEQLDPHEQKLKDLGLPTLAETKEYRENVGWVPYEEYMRKIYFHHPGRDFDDWNMQQGYFDKQLEPNRLLREAAYLIGLKLRPSRFGKDWTEDDQKELEEELYNTFMINLFEVTQESNPWPSSEN